MEEFLRPQVEYWVEFQDGTKSMKSDGYTLQGYMPRFEAFVKGQKEGHPNLPVVRTWVDFEGRRLEYREEKPSSTELSNKVQFEFWVRFDNGLVEKETFAFAKGNSFIEEYTKQFAEFEAEKKAAHPALSVKDKGAKIAGRTFTQQMREERKKLLLGEGNLTTETVETTPKEIKKKAAKEKLEKRLITLNETPTIKRRRQKRMSARTSANLPLLKPALETENDIVKRKLEKPKENETKEEINEVPVLIIHKKKSYSKLKNSISDANFRKDKLMSAYKMLSKIGEEAFRIRLITELHPEVTAAQKAGENLKKFFDLINNGRIYDKGLIGRYGAENDRRFDESAETGEWPSSAVRLYIEDIPAPGDKEALLKKKRLEVKEQTTSFSVPDMTVEMTNTEGFSEPEAKEQVKPKIQEIDKPQTEEYSEPKEKERVEDDIKVRYEALGIVIRETEYDNRIKLYFKGKPQYEVREVLKKNAFRWSPKNICWQRPISENAHQATEIILDKLRALQIEKERGK